MSQCWRAYCLTLPRYVLEKKKTSLDSGVLPSGRGGRVCVWCVCVCEGGGRGRSSVPVSVPGLELLGSSLHHGVLAHLPLLVSSIARRKSCSGWSYLYISLFSTILSIVSVFFVFILCFCSHFSCVAYSPFFGLLGGLLVWQ